MPEVQWICRYRSRASVNDPIKYQDQKKCDLYDFNYHIIVGARWAVFYDFHTTVSRVYTELCKKLLIREVRGKWPVWIEPQKVYSITQIITLFNHVKQQSKSAWDVWATTAEGSTSFSQEQESEASIGAGLSKIRENYHLLFFQSLTVQFRVCFHDGIELFDTFPTFLPTWNIIRDMIKILWLGFARFYVIWLCRTTDDNVFHCKLFEEGSFLLC